MLPLEQIGAGQTAGVSMIFVAMLAAFFASKHGPGVVSSLHRNRKGAASKDLFRVSAIGGDEMMNRSRSDSLQRRPNAAEMIEPVVNGVVLTAKPVDSDKYDENGW